MILQINKQTFLSYTVLLTCILFLSSSGYSGEDSPLNRFSQIKNDRIRIDSLLNYSSVHMLVDSNLSIAAAEEAKQLATAIKNDTCISKSYHQLGNVLYYRGKYKLALFNYSIALKYAEKANIQDCIARSSGNIGTIYETLGNYPKALEYQLESLEAEKNTNNKKGIADTYNNIGNIYFLINNFDIALDYYKNALSIFYAEEDHQGIAYALNNIGSVFNSNKLYDKALLYFNSALLENKNLNNLDGQSSVLSNIGRIYIETKKFGKAAQSINSSLKLDRQTNDYWGLANNYLNLARLQLAKGACASANQAVDSSLAIIHQYALDDLKIDAYYILAEIAYQLKDFPKAVAFHKQYNQIRDSVISKELNDRIEQYHLEKTVASYIESNATLKAIAEEKSGVARKRRNINLLITGNLILLVIAAFTFVYYTRKRKRQRSLLEKRNQEIEGINEQLKDFNQELESRVEERSHALQQEIEERIKADADLEAGLIKAEEANYLKNAFLANISHEIRTPLNGILGFSSLLETELALLEDESLYEYADSITQSGDRLLHLLNDIIDISRIEANDLEIHLVSCDLSEIVRSKVEQYDPRAKEKGIKIIYADDHIKRIHADPEIVARIITVVLDNAVKFTNKGFIKVYQEVSTQIQMVVLSVKDTGIGIDKVFLSQVFDAFRQESLGYSTSYQGAGLGLPLSKKMIELLGGKIEISSDKGSGTLVQLFFPISVAGTKESDTEPIVDARPSTSTHRTIHTSPVNATAGRDAVQAEAVEKTTDDDKLVQILAWENKSILVVEDDRMNQILFKKMLVKSKVLVIASDGDDALKHIAEMIKKHIEPDVILMDINLPAPWDGISLMKEIKNTWPSFQHIPFIAQTAYAMSGDKEKMLDQGFDDYISKPIMKKELQRAISKCLISQQ